MSYIDFYGKTLWSLYTETPKLDPINRITLEDAIKMLQANKQDQLAWEILFRRATDLLPIICRKNYVPQDLKEDVLQEALRIVIENVEAFDSKKSSAEYFLTMIVGCNAARIVSTRDNRIRRVHRSSNGDSVLKEAV